MIEMDKRVYEKMVAIWSITRIPQLQMRPTVANVSFVWARGEIAAVPFTVFDELAPIEIVDLIEKKMEKNYGINAKQYRANHSGYLADPFSSQR